MKTYRLILAAALAAFGLSTAARADTGTIAVTTYMIDTTAVAPADLNPQVSPGPGHDRELMRYLLAHGAVLVGSPTLSAPPGVVSTANFDNHNGITTQLGVAATGPQDGVYDVKLTVTQMHQDGNGFEIDVEETMTPGDPAEGFKDDKPGDKAHFVVFLKVNDPLDQSAATPGAPAPPADNFPQTLKLAWNGGTVDVPKAVPLPDGFYDSLSYKTWLDVGGPSTLSFPQQNGETIIVTVQGYLDANAKTPLITRIDVRRADGTRRASTIYGTAKDLPIQWLHCASDSILDDRAIVDTAKDGTRYIQYVDIFNDDGSGKRYQANPQGVAYIEWCIDPDGLIKRKLAGSESLNH